MTDANVPDTVQAVFQYPGGIYFSYECSLANSFDADYEMFYGTDSAIMLRGNKAWMFKEVDAPLLGWEVYAHKDSFFQETRRRPCRQTHQIDTPGANPGEDSPYTSSPLHYALEAFNQPTPAIPPPRWKISRATSAITPKASKIIWRASARADSPPPDIKKDTNCRDCHQSQ